MRLLFSKTYYEPNAFKTVKDNYVSTATKVITRFMREQNLTASANLRDQVQGLVEFEQMIANTYSTDDTTRRTYNRSWNLKGVDDLQNAYPFMNWKVYLNQVPKTASTVVSQPGFQVSVYEVQFKFSFVSSLRVNIIETHYSLINTKNSMLIIKSWTRQS
ncbi:hypothetical protein COOONC_07568 [Cooperia oncophora]